MVAADKYMVSAFLQSLAYTNISSAIKMGVKWPTGSHDGIHMSSANGGRSSVATASEFKSKDTGFDPLVWQDEGQFFCPSESTLVQTCLCLTPLPLSSCVRHAPKTVRMLKIPYPSVVKE